MEDLIKDKSLLIVPSGALTQLPFEALVTEKPDEGLPRFEAYKSARWLGQRQAVTVLPSVGSLKALRTAKGSAATELFAGFGNPLLDGVDGKDKSAWAKQTCAKSPAPGRTRIASLTAAFLSIFRGGQVNVEDLRHQPPLPETADELCAVAKTLGVPEARLDSAVYLGERATVAQVKALSASGDLARARVVHFATHGLLAGQTAMFAKNKAEPALLLTPPAAASEDDNGLLTASEVAQLNLNADWVVMSACNTAAGSNEGAEALSGLARAFFYAGARSLLVSHWEVDSEAAVAITTGAMNAMKAEPKIGRAEALRRSIAALIARGGRFAHPSVWAPFVLVGNGEQWLARRESSHIYLLRPCCRRGSTRSRYQALDVDREQPCRTLLSMPTIMPWMPAWTLAFCALRSLAPSPRQVPWCSRRAGPNPRARCAMLLRYPWACISI